MRSRILVVDDEPDLELLIVQKFRKQIRTGDFSFTFARDGIEALERLKNDTEIDIVLTDINMPRMDGLDLLNHLKDMQDFLKAIIISAYDDMENIRTAMNRGAFDFVTKPINFQDLEVTIEKALQESQALKQASVEHDRLVTIEQELTIAHQIQISMLPKTSPGFLQGNGLEISYTMKPAREVGGDFYDFFPIDEDRLGIVIGDVSGKSVPAALFMAVSKTLLKSTALKGLSPCECLQHINNILFQDSVLEMFVTIFYGVLDTRTGEIECCNAGHNHPYLLHRDGRVERLETAGGLIVGIIEDSQYQSSKILLHPGDAIFLYTDGVTEAADGTEELFGEERLAEFLERNHNMTSKELTEGIIREIEGFSHGDLQQDDMTVLTLRRRVPEEA